MDKYIKREAVFEQFDNGDADVIETYPDGSVDFGFGASNIRNLINAIPAADVAPVVHCRHCRSYNKPRLGWCSVHLDREGPDDFCGYGVRMDGDAE